MYFCELYLDAKDLCQLDGSNLQDEAHVTSGVATQESLQQQWKVNLTTVIEDIDIVDYSNAFTI